MFSAVLIMGFLGLIIGLCLSFASKIFYVYVDPKVTLIDGILPGANCGGCGMPGCTANAEAIVLGKVGPDSCVAAGNDVTKAIASVMGISVEAKEPNIALLDCMYSTNETDIKFYYNGISDCRAANFLNGGSKFCNIGCIGLGTCALECPFDAIIMNSNLPVIDLNKCTGCGTCEKVCPKKIIKLSSVTKRILLEYTTNDCTTPCQRACPAGINISKYIELISQKKYFEAIEIIKERNPFPGVIGRICPRTCESVCRRKDVDESLAINDLKRFVSSYEMKMGKHILPYKAPNTNKKIAIVGGGVHGLSTAYFSARLGHNPTIFEATNKLGGILNFAIKKKILPNEILEWDIEGIIKLGVNLELSKRVGFNLSLTDIFKKNFETIFIASGGWDSRLVYHDNNDYKVFNYIFIIFLLIDYLNNNFVCEGNLEIICVGGQFLLNDIFEKSKILNVKKITFLYEKDDIDLRNLYNKCKNKNIDVEFINNATITKLFGKNNELNSIEIKDLISNESRILNANIILFSSGRLPEMIFYKLPEENLLKNSILWIGVFTNKPPQIKTDDLIFGNTLSDFTSAIKAINAGRMAAVDMHKIIFNLKVKYPNNILTFESYIQDINFISGVSVIPKNNLVYENEGLAISEASRCLKCGLTCYKKSY